MTGHDIIDAALAAISPSVPREPSQYDIALNNVRHLASLYPPKPMTSICGPAFEMDGAMVRASISGRYVATDPVTGAWLASDETLNGLSRKLRGEA